MSLKNTQIIRENIENEWINTYNEMWSNSELNPLSVIWNEDSDRGQLEIKFSGQFCVNFKTVRITDTIFLNIFTTVQFFVFAI